MALYLDFQGMSVYFHHIMIYIISNEVSVYYWYLSNLLLHHMESQVLGTPLFSDP